MARKVIDAKSLTGLFIDQDPKRGCIFYDIFTKKGYIITNQDVKTYNIYSLSLPIGIMAAYVLTIINVEFKYAALIGLVVYLFLKVLFRFKFIYTLPEIPDYKRKNKESFITSMAKKYSPARLGILFALLVAIAVLTSVNAIQANYEGINLYLNYGLSACVLVVAFVTLISLFVSIKYHKK